LLDEALRYYRERFSETGIYENSLYPGVVPAVQRILASGVRLCLATSKPTVFAIPILSHFGLTRFFDGIYGSDLDGRLSDKGDLLAHILKAEDLGHQLAIIAGDRSHDVFGGKKNGIMTAALTYG